MHDDRSREPVRRTLRWRLRAWARLTAFSLFVGALGLWWVHTRVSAAVSERALLVGRQLSTASELHAGTTPLLLNGQAIALNSRTVSMSVHTVIERFAAQCRSASGGVVDELIAAEAQGKSLPPSVTPARFGIMRAEPSAGEGTAACFARTGTAGVRGLLDDLSTVLETGDVAALGQFRYVFARTAKSGDGAHVITVYSRGALRLFEMFPEQGDAPGHDAAAGVRPPRARRLLSADTQHTAMRATAYESESTPRDILTHYDQALAKEGYQPLASDTMDVVLPVPVRVYQKPDSHGLLVMVHEGEGRTFVSAFQLAAKDYARAEVEP